MERWLCTTSGKSSDEETVLLRCCLTEGAGFRVPHGQPLLLPKLWPHFKNTWDLSFSLISSAWASGGKKTQNFLLRMQKRFPGQAQLLS